MKTKYKIVKCLESIPFVNIYLIRNVNKDKNYILNQINITTKTDDEKKDILEQIELFKELDHPNILKIKNYFFQNQPLKYLNIESEFADGGDLFKKIKEQSKEPFPESQILDYFIQVCLALQILHKKKIVDFSLRSPKIFLTKSGLVKLGYYRYPKGQKDTMNPKDIKYGFNDKISPDNKDVINNAKRDIWFLGELLYLLLTFKMPFNPTKLFYAKKFSPPPEVYSTGIKDLLTKCLSSYPENRPSINDILQLPIIKDRINNYLNEVQYDENLYKIIAKKYKDRKTKKKYEKDKMETPKAFLMKKKKNEKEKEIEIEKKKGEFKQESIKKINKTNFLSQKKDPNFQKGKIYKEDEIGKVLNDKGYFDLIDENGGNFNVNKMTKDQYNQLRLLNNLNKVLNNQELDLEND